MDYSTSNTLCMSDDIRALAVAFAEAKKKFTATGKSARNSHQGYSYATIGDIYSAVEDALLANNIIIWHFAFADGDKEVLYTRLIHTITGQYVQDGRYITAEKPGNQGKGAANSYVRKYAVLSLCAIAAEDDDGQEEETYINEPTITAEQLATLQNDIKACNNKTTIYNNILKFNQISKLDDLKASSFQSVRNYVSNAKE